MNIMAPRRLTQLVLYRGQLGANWVPIVPQLAYDRAPIGVRFGSDNGQNGILNRP